MVDSRSVTLEGTGTTLAPKMQRSAAGLSGLIADESGVIAIPQHAIPLGASGRRAERALKRGMDVLASLVGLVLLAPVFAIVAVAVRLSSEGPCLYLQERIGRRGRRFKIIKFRTMHQGADGRIPELMGLNVYGDPRLFKVAKDPRITRVGGWLRKSSIDELPQLWNVLRGEMSLVGPRPPLAHEVALYAEHHFARLGVLPGITGPWQVAGRNLITDFEEVVRLEREYIENWSLWRDLRILFETIPTVVLMRGAH